MIKPIVREHCTSPLEESIESMLEVAYCLSSSGTEQRSHAVLHRIHSQATVNEVKMAIELLLNDAWSDIQSIRSYNLRMPM